MHREALVSSIAVTPEIKGLNSELVSAADLSLELIILSVSFSVPKGTATVHRQTDRQTITITVCYSAHSSI